MKHPALVQRNPCCTISWVITDLLYFPSGKNMRAFQPHFTLGQNMLHMQHHFLCNIYSKAHCQLGMYDTQFCDIPYSRKYWRALNLAVEPQIAIRRILADLNLAVRYGITIHIYASRKFWRILIWRL